MINYVIKLIVLLSLLISCVGCGIFIGEKEHKSITVEASNGNIVFLLPQLPALHTLYVEKFNPERSGENKWETVWMLSFSASSRKVPNSVDRIIYGKPPKGAVAGSAEPADPLKAGVLYSVSMDIGSVLASGNFIISDSISYVQVKSLTDQEAVDFVRENQ